jgi:membrane protease subunit HflC
MDAQKIKGEGDAEATRIYNLAYSKDPEFYKFYRSLVTYKASLSKDNSSFVLSPNSEFFKYLRLGN